MPVNLRWIFPNLWPIAGSGENGGAKLVHGSGGMIRLRAA